MVKKLFVFAALIIICILVFFPFRLSVTGVPAFYEPEKPDIEATGTEVFSLLGVNMPVKADIVLDGRGDGSYVLTARWMYLSASRDLEPVRIRSIEAEYKGSVYAGDEPDASAMAVSVVYEDGSCRALTDFTVTDVQETDSGYRMTVDTAFGSCRVDVPVIPVTSVRAFYSGNEGLFDRKLVSTEAVYSDGAVRPVYDFTASAPDTLAEGDEIIVYALGFSASATVTSDTSVHKADAVHASGASRQAGEKADIRAVVFSYGEEDLTIPAEEVEFLNDPGTVLKEGDNAFRIRYEGFIYTLHIHANKDSIVADAREAFDEEYRLADYKYVSDNIFVTISEHTTGEASYFLTHVVINDPAQLRSGLSHGGYGGERELPTDAAARLNWIVGTNGSNFNYGTGKPEYAGVCIKDGKVMDGTVTNGMEICLMDNGVLFSPDSGVPAESLIRSGVTDSWSCGDTLLIDNGQAVNTSIQSEQYRYPRTAVGMVQPCEYYLLTAGESGYSKGMTYDEVRSVLLSRGCSFGKCMDGGGSSSLVFLGELINTPAVGGEERAVADFLYFTEG